jgi:hypothetical protein
MASTYTLISSNVLSSSAASVTFSSIPSTYTDLVLRFSARVDGAVGNSNGKLQFNGDTSTANYSYTFLQGNGSAASSSNNPTGVIGYIQISRYADGASATANTFSNVELYIPSYTASQKKPIYYYAAQEDNTTTAYLFSLAGLYQSNSAISSLTITDSSYNLIAGSSFYLYGIKNS